MDATSIASAPPLSDRFNADTVAPLALIVRNTTQRYRLNIRAVGRAETGRKPAIPKLNRYVEHFYPTTDAQPVR